MMKVFPIIKKYAGLWIVLTVILMACKPVEHSPTLTPIHTPLPSNPPPPTQTPIPVGVTIKIYADEYQQTIGQIGGGNFIHYFGGSTSATEAVSQMNIDLFQPKYARVAIELQEWEPVNDNTDALSMDQAGFIDDQHNHATFELMKQFKENGVEITASIWRVPDWLVEDPQDESPRIIARGMYPEAVESIAAWLLHARDTYGVEVDYVSFNEANLGVTVILTSQDVVEMIRTGGERFAELGLKTKWLLGDCSSIRGCLEYVEPVWAVQDIRPYIGPLAFHNWDGTSVSDQTIQALGDWAVEQGLDVRCTEGGWDAQLWQRSEEFAGWPNARQLAISYVRTLKLSRAAAFYYWEMMGQDYQLNDGVKPYPVMQVLLQISDAFPPGTQIVKTSSNKPAIVWAAGKTPSGDLSLVTVSSTASDTARVTGLPNGLYDIFTSTREGFGTLSGTYDVTDGTLTFSIPGFSVVLLQSHH
jgi:hypothetical protein